MSKRRGKLGELVKIFRPIGLGGRRERVSRGESLLEGSDDAAGDGAESGRDAEEGREAGGREMLDGGSVHPTGEIRRWRLRCPKQIIHDYV